MKLFSAFLFSILSCFTLAQQQVQLLWNQKPFELEKLYPINDTSAVRISELKFYLQGASKNVMQNIHLIDASDIGTWTWENPITSLQVGIDASIQTSSNFTDELDPIHGMYWAWNTGFISVKCAGEYINLKNESSQEFEYHLGGYQAPFACIKELQGRGAILNCDLYFWFEAILNSKNQECLIMQPSKASLQLFELFTASLSYGQ